jgi:LemA protein
MEVLLILLAVVLVIALFIASIYNSLVRLKNQVKNAWSQINVQLKRRYDLIPNLVEIVKEYMQHERETLESITRLRAQAMQTSGVEEKAKAEGMLTQALGQFKIAVENYPNLKANENFLAVQEELKSTENKIAFSRQNYNDQVLFYNNKIEMFPSNIFANMFGFKQEPFFELENPEEGKAVKVSF